MRSEGGEGGFSAPSCKEFSSLDIVEQLVSVGAVRDGSDYRDNVLTLTTDDLGKKSMCY